MERSPVHLLRKRGKSLRAIAAELGHSKTTIAQALSEPVDQRPPRRQRVSLVDPWRSQIVEWLRHGLSEIPRVDLGGGRYAAWMLGMAPFPWARELRMPLLQSAIARRHGVDSDLVSVGWYFFGTGEYQAETFSAGQVVNATAEVEQLRSARWGVGRERAWQARCPACG
jgi:hypothetical protein